MRIIKLGKTDASFRKREMVDPFFRETLPGRPNGEFFLPSERTIGPNGMAVGERLVFAYEGQCVYKARAASGRRANSGRDSATYPFCFNVNVGSIEPFRRSLSQLQSELEGSGLYRGNLTTSRTWPRIIETDANIPLIDSILGPFRNSSPPKSRAATDLAVPPRRVHSQIYRIMRDTELSRRVKAMHGYRCQIAGCAHMIRLPDGSYYAEGHHIQPLGRDHNGPDVMGNILCLCPNHHAELDLAANPIDLSTLRQVDGHTVDPRYVEYHNRQICRRS